ncbi:NERD domain-containing protein [Oceanobacillus caeni]|uniref:Nuclease n=1 Tax=Oceanobacillus caeni TaxID=405946 RepID=A0ABR5MK94_9BACI|nr:MULTISPECIES: nuclease-related domain-containing protein [Bacillaceae]KKE80431.1 nuclease [Bacilli bacterium VT-13-104]PZD83368.1 NERD domain-containing protein [Bacilli bacterium]KPH76169.1 nuclease [Oceanobacillus caeni]MBU8789935.1 NERD domain-containing protein [Oceanobacillus caeni]MCR1834331.1 NERD domain-containing protein [Oceanobacillus caeni]
MIFKYRTKPIDLKILELLNPRMNLTNKDKQHYYNQKRGYEGEVMFDTLTEKLQCECFILNDLLLEINNTTFQIDSLLILQEAIYFYEVKNFEGDYYYDSDKIFKKPKTEIVNPLHQLSRSESLLRQLLLKLGYTLPIHASIVFINPTFTLYQAPLNQPIIFPTQIKNYLSHLNKTPSKLSKWHEKLADQLTSLHITDSPYKKVPSYNYNQLRKGITCFQCHSFSVSVEKRKCVCHNCSYKEPISNAVLRTIKEFQTLFPNEKITTNMIQDWCQVVESKKAIRRILATNFNRVGVNQWTYYE